MVLQNPPIIYTHPVLSRCTSGAGVRNWEPTSYEFSLCTGDHKELLRIWRECWYTDL